MNQEKSFISRFLDLKKEPQNQDYSYEMAVDMEFPHAKDETKPKKNESPA